MLGFAACGGDWVLFCDADFEVDAVWVGEALELADRRPELGGIWGRVEEWFEDGNGQRPGNLDLFGVGRDERAVKYLTTPALYRRRALTDVGGYDPRLNSEEDFELGMRLRRARFKLVSLGHAAGRHWSAPRPSFAEIGRRWRAGLLFGQGQVLRIYSGHSGFVTLLWRQRLYLAMLALWTFGALAGITALLMRNPRVFYAWALLPLVLLVLMALRKRSARLALHSLLSWTALGLGLVAGWFRLRAGTHAPVSGGRAC
jgi:GT2 family glycosyltransferase